jgi:hypothetical protein
MKKIDKPIVLLDMDGVIANFIEAVLFNLKRKAVTDPNFIPNGKFEDLQYQLWDKWNKHLDLGISDAEFWKATKTDNFWEFINPYPWASTLIHNLNKAGCHVLYTTSPSLDSICASAKINWLRVRSFMSDHANDYVIGPHKYLMAPYPNLVLVDDSDDNVKIFEECGGKAITFPAPWNKRRAEAVDPYCSYNEAAGFANKMALEIEFALATDL